MRKFPKYFVILTLLLLCSSIAVLATTHEDLIKPNMPDVQLGEMYDRRDIFPHPNEVSPVPLPEPEETEAMSTIGQPKAGPIASADRSVPGFGSALVAPRGGAVSTPKQQADREIRRLIRRLN